MKNQYLKILGVILLLVLVILIIIKNGIVERTFNQVILSTDNQIYNRTKTPYYDTIMSVGLSSMNIKNVKVIITNLSKETKNNFEGELKAHIRYHQGVFYLFINDESRVESIDIISHEIVHIMQYQSKNLIFENDKVFYKNTEYNLTNIPYEDRPWEIEAFEKQKEVRNLIENSLY